MEKIKELAVRLKISRESMGLTQRDVADELDITPSAYANYEQGLREPSLVLFSKICEVLDVSADYLLGLENWE